MTKTVWILVRRFDNAPDRLRFLYSTFLSFDDAEFVASHSSADEYFIFDTTLEFEEGKGRKP